MSEIISAFKVGDLMFEQDLTWQATVFLWLLFAFMVACIAVVAGKAVKVWREALKEPS